MPTIITDYTDIIDLERAKIYLRIDLDMIEDDKEITSMIKASFRFIERYTNHIFGARDFVQKSCGNIYDYPLNSIVGISESDMVELRNIYLNIPANVGYNAGYTNVEDVPDDFIQIALQMIKVFYFESEKQANSTLIPISVTMVLDTYRRFV